MGIQAILSVEERCSLRLDVVGCDLSRFPKAFEYFLKGAASKGAVIPTGVMRKFKPRSVQTPKDAEKLIKSVQGDYPPPGNLRTIQYSVLADAMFTYSAYDGTVLQLSVVQSAQRCTLVLKGNSSETLKSRFRAMMRKNK